MVTSLFVLAACDANSAPLLILPTEMDAQKSAASQTAVAARAEDVAAAIDGIALTVEPLVEGLTRPVFVTHAGDGSGRLFIVEQAGRIRIWQDGALLETPFLDLEERVNDNGNEQGLLGLAFAPNYVESGFFFINYTDLQGDTVVARFQVSAAEPNRVDAESEFVVLQLAQPARNHNGGMLAFGPDGYLYIGAGDGGGSGDRYGNGQNPETLLGAILRIDVTSNPTVPYTIPADNPWVNADWPTADGDAIDARDEILAIGLRNPWRFSFDRATGDLWIGDVGQRTTEEVDFAPAAALAPGAVQPANFGWPIMEGTSCYQSDECDASGLDAPIFEYDHSGHCSITGGYVYRGAQYVELQGAYLFGDYCSGTIWSTTPTAEGWRTAVVLQSDVQISSFGEDENGELYLTAFDGKVYQLGVE
ncbi:MAG: PQQ-dependent sugar dehydrogenase [Caldilineaceae bacterium]